ncbi:MAG: CDP-glucose 4,6-dehydratase [Actinobacteria bacterium]|uniref:Unannotated protein n=1 Tax=freshwater metagenome TaxID=449393 RepID=A0A6J5YHW9_9ZZZZ|nr:CDP-glucose 4,6-dehydratase [Actinomycetota bacterium]
MHYLVTGHTGFKGAWLTLLLKQLGHDVSGLSLDPEPNSLFEKAQLSDYLVDDFRIDIREYETVSQAFSLCNADVLIHMAAQPLVRESYLQPRQTYETNVMGTFNILEASQLLTNVKAILVITTDKVYRNTNRAEGYSEWEPLGGEDPYSSSKAMADILTSSWIHSFGKTPTAIARAGNVIGGGDVSKDRLMPDLLAAYDVSKQPTLRFPNAIRPWQHVLDCIDGYLAIVDHLLKGGTDQWWNVGPDESANITVGEVADRVAALYGQKPQWTNDQSQNPSEAGLLALDSTKIRNKLSWSGKLSVDDAIAWTVEWQQSVNSGKNALEISNDQVKRFRSLK